MDKKLYHEASVYMTFGKNKGAINKFSKILENAKDIGQSSCITVLIQRATCYYREKMCKEALVDLKKVIDLGYKIKENEQMFFMYHFCNIQAPIDEVLEDLREVAIKYGYNCSKRIAYLKKVDLDILANSNAGGSQNRGRSQSAKR
ncbi:unnamed protein product [Rotaria magnacalcarata]|uniref:Uncharacterized protein n=1 Tax=Rotaria magnacalcarata TaxID=392030 RepID=A0A819MWK6_9BILA|nr:unnamed protein product [Rotaria magnacalcarata]CAF1605021.1 unnamed protein product [Rotaria magnacalcarata]CAF2117354.1 unnamed protein product [Rotaria magnacalcarata]CAF2181839.1 unnamed protein product [Rotaria magnacalcarata]CAF3986310.1 unnamed protein product [Rotaria magnacalcarata]